VADQMQRIAGDVAQLSDDVFDEASEKTRELRKKLVRIGQLEGRLARYRTSLLGIGRVVGFVQHRAPDWIDADTMACLKVLSNDLKVLDQFDEQLTSKLQFLQDGVLGFINTDQNAVMKLLTVASVVTIPPVILAGIWGMNFRHMPELDKVWGYPMALAALLVSMVLPLAWFGMRGWLSRD
jgi:magnesium transporter